MNDQREYEIIIFKILDLLIMYQMTCYEPAWHNYCIQQFCWLVGAKYSSTY